MANDKIAKVFTSGGSQAVRRPDEFRDLKAMISPYGLLVRLGEE